MSDEPIFGSAFRAKAERLSLVARKVFSGLMKGENLGPRKGTSTEFLDYREYSPGDDFRYVDWNIYGRLDQLLLKLYREEQSLRMTILLDVSESMDFGQVNKIDHARRLAAALAYIGMANLDRVDLFPFADRLQEGARNLSGKGRLESLFVFLNDLEPSGQTDLRRVARDAIARRRRNGLIVLISDLLDLDGYRSALKTLVAPGNDLYILQILDAEEERPDLRGAVRLGDVETGRTREITATEGMLARYRKAVQAHSQGVETFCRRHGFGYALARTEIPFDHLVLTILRKGGLVS